MSAIDKEECLKSLVNVAQKESKEAERVDIRDYYLKVIDLCMKLIHDNKNIYDNLGIRDLKENKEISKRVQDKAGIYEDLPQQDSLQTIIEQSSGIVDLLDKATTVQSENKSESPVHGAQHVRNVLLLVNYLCQQKNISDNDLEILREAAIYHDRCHKKAGHKEHAKEGADFYLQEVETEFELDKKMEVAFLIEAHEIDGEKQIEQLINERFTNITEERKKELLTLALILQDADRLDMLRYDIENKNRQRFNPAKLNDPGISSRLISAVIELNTRQAIATGFLNIDNPEFDKLDLLKLYFERGITIDDTNGVINHLKPPEKDFSLIEANLDSVEYDS